MCNSCMDYIVIVLHFIEQFMRNKAMYFWLTFGSFTLLACCFLFMMYSVFEEEFTITWKKEYGIFLLPVFFYFMFQFIVNYCEMIEDKK